MPCIYNKYFTSRVTLLRITGNQHMNITKCKLAKPQHELQPKFILSPFTIKIQYHSLHLLQYPKMNYPSLHGFMFFSLISVRGY